MCVIIGHTDVNLNGIYNSDQSSGSYTHESNNIRLAYVLSQSWQLSQTWLCLFPLNRTNTDTFQWQLQLTGSTQPSGGSKIAFYYQFNINNVPMLGSGKSGTSGLQFGPKVIWFDWDATTFTFVETRLSITPVDLDCEVKVWYRYCRTMSVLCFMFVNGLLGGEWIFGLCPSRVLHKRCTGAIFHWQRWKTGKFGTPPTLWKAEAGMGRLQHVRVGVFCKPRWFAVYCRLVYQASPYLRRTVSVLSLLSRVCFYRVSHGTCFLDTLKSLLMIWRHRWMRVFVALAIDTHTVLLPSLKWELVGDSILSIFFVCLCVFSW